MTQWTAKQRRPGDRVVTLPLAWQLPCKPEVMFAVVSWKNGKIPVDPDGKTAAVRRLPRRLMALFTAPADWLKQLTPVKLICLARAHQKLKPATEAEILVLDMKAAIQVWMSLSLMEPK